MTTIAVKLNRLDDISKDMSQINTKMSVLKPMLANMQEMNNYLSLQIIEHKDLVLGLEHAHAVFLVINQQVLPF
jgi:hypothetical protein